MPLKMTHEDFFKRTYNRKFQSVWTATLGANQSGKTDFNLYQMEKLHALGLGDGFGSNIPDLKAPFDIDFIEDFETLKKTCQMLNPDPERFGIKRYFFLGDEMGDWAPKDQPWLNVKFIKELQQVRKYGLCFLGCAISRVDSRILNEKHFHGYFEKVNKANPTIAIYRDWFRGGKPAKIYDIPRTNIGFNTWYSASFHMQPQIPEDAIIPMNDKHQLVKKYLKTKSWKKLGVHPQEGKNAVLDVLNFHMDHCLQSLHEHAEDKGISVPVDAE